MWTFRSYIYKKQIYSILLDYRPLQHVCNWEDQILQSYQSCDDFLKHKPSFRSQPCFGLFGVGLVWDLLLNRTFSEKPHKARLWGAVLMGHDVTTDGVGQTCLGCSKDLPSLLWGFLLPQHSFPAPGSRACPLPPHSSMMLCVYFEKSSAKLFKVILYCKGEN